MNDLAKSVAELAAMRARGELTAEQFEEAKKLLHQTPVTEAETVPLKPSPQVKVSAPKKKGGCRQILLWVVLILGGLLAFGFYLESQKTPEQRAQEAAQRQAEREKEAQEAAIKAAQEQSEEAEKRRKGFHCLSGWDGSHRGLVDAVSKSLRDPDSFEHAETKITPVDANGQHTVIMTFRAKNGFGGTNVGSAMGEVRQSDCALVSWTLISS